MELVSAALTAAVTEIAKGMAAAAMEMGKHLPRLGSADSHRFEIALQEHLQDIDRWCSIVQIYGMSDPVSTDRDTIDLHFSGIPRRFGSDLSATETFSEDQIMARPSSQLILGDPGAGKTTVLKRMALRLLSEEPGQYDNMWGIPIVIRLREYDWDSRDRGYDQLVDVLLGVFGFPEPTRIAISREVADLSRQYAVVNSEHQKLLAAKDKKAPPIISEEQIELEVQMESLRVQIEGLRRELSTTGPVEERARRRLLVEVLDRHSAVVLADGLDEIDLGSRSRVEELLIKLDQSTATAKIMVTCRSGEHERNLDGFQVTQLCPLAPDQVRTIAERWISDADEFLVQLEASPILELATRPLYLVSLITIYRGSGVVVDEPRSIYEYIVDLILRDWDRTNRVRRHSRYGGFTPYKKRDFLAALAFYFTYKKRTSSFSRQDLEEAYRGIYSSFSLPINEAKEVAGEIETHTGLIVQTGHSQYAFSHLTLQEYLCAYHLIRDPSLDQIDSFVNINPHAAAVAVALSSNPNVFLEDIFGDILSFQDSSILPFLKRLLIERPAIRTSSGLALQVLTQMERCQESRLEVAETLADLCRIEGGLRDSIDQLLGGRIRAVVEPQVLDLERASSSQTVRLGHAGSGTEPPIFLDLDLWNRARSFSSL